MAGIAGLAYVGMEEREVAGRKIIEWEDNCNASYVPSKLWKDRPNIQKKVKDLVVAKKINEVFIENLAEDLECHVQTRILLAFQQCMLAYNTDLIFSYGGAQLQVGSGNSKYASAHCCTIPHLICERDGETFDFAAGTRFERDANTTTLVPKAVNQPIETHLDEGTKVLKQAKSLRDKYIITLNKVADVAHSMTPIRGLEKILEEIQLRLQYMDSNTGSYTGCEAAIIRIYLRVITTSLTAVTDNPTRWVHRFFSGDSVDLQAFMISKRDEMHALLVREGQTWVTPVTKYVKKSPVSKNKDLWANVFTWFEACEQIKDVQFFVDRKRRLLHLTMTQFKYASDCLCSETVQRIGREYLEGASANDLIIDLEAIQQTTRWADVRTQVVDTVTWESVAKACLQQIVGDVKQFHLIFRWVLTELNFKLDERGKEGRILQESKIWELQKTHLGSAYKVIRLFLDKQLNERRITV